MKYHTGIPIGSGGMGEVLRAWDPTLNREVALKFLRSDSVELEERMIREAQAQARVSHPNICPVYEVGRHDGRVYIAMQYIDGERLDSAAGDLGTEQKVMLVRTVAEAIHAAHTVGLVHRDLKPANILVEKDENGELRPWVVDFGIAREHGVQGATITGQVVGTPGYMSPEQARGEITTIDRRTDVFSLGVVLYELLAGCRPHPGDSEVEVLVSLLQEEPVPLRRRAPHVPRELETVVMTCLEGDREQRYPSAQALADDLGRFLAGEPVTARPTGMLRWMTGRARRHPLITGLLSAAAIAIVGLVIGLVATQYRARTEAEIAQRLGFQVKGVEDRMQRAMLLPIHDISDERDELARQLAELEHQVSSLGRQGRGPARLALGRGYLALGRLEEAQAHLEGAWSDGYRSAEVVLALGHTLGLLYQKARNEALHSFGGETRERRLRLAREQLRDRALALLHTLDLESSRSGSSLLQAEIALYEDDWEQAVRLAQAVFEAEPGRYQAAELTVQALLLGAEQTWRSGSIDRSLALLDEVDRSLGEAIEIARSDPQLHQHVCDRWTRAMGALVSQGEDPSPAFEQALEASRRLLRVDPDSAFAYIAQANAGWILAEYQRHHGQDPRPALQETIEAAQSALGLAPQEIDAHLFAGLAAWYFGEIEMRTGGDGGEWLRRAEGSFRQAVALQPGSVEGYTNLGIVLAVQGQAAERSGEDPEAFWRRAIESYNRALEMENDSFVTWLNLGVANTLMAIHTQRIGSDPSPWLDGAISSFERVVSLRPGTALAHSNLATAYSRKVEHLRDIGGDFGPVLEAGITAARQAVAIDSSFAAGHSALANQLWLLADDRFGKGGDPQPLLEEAAAAFAEAARLNPAHSYVLPYIAGAWRTLAEYQLASGKDPIAVLAKADHALTVAAQAEGTNPDTHAELAEVALLHAQWTRAAGGGFGEYLDRATRAIASASAEAGESETVQMARANLARLRLELVATSSPASEYEAGIAAADRALELNPVNDRARAIRGALRMLGGDPKQGDAAIEDLETALRRNPALRAEYSRYLEEPQRAPGSPL